ncbi:hypothetical protein D3C71_2035520 [compost metagenome]
MICADSWMSTRLLAASTTYARAVLSTKLNTSTSEMPMASTHNVSTALLGTTRS